MKKQEKETFADKIVVRANYNINYEGRDFRHGEIFELSAAEYEYLLELKLISKMEE